ncbi:MAG: DNA-binding transcriptional LysR family regulator [Candidatus Poriferisodalaceae bacterium]|jgi:DNA-binding transcriptional LysR family regulator
MQRRGSLTDAAFELSVSQSAVSHAVAKLESALGYQVFVRSKAGVSLTGLGRTLHDRISGPLVNLSEAVSEALQPARPATVTLSVSTSLASFWLLPRLSEFKLRHPEVELRLITTDSDNSVGLDAADLWIPLGRSDNADLEAVFFCEEELIPVASPNMEGLPSYNDIDAIRRAPLLALEERYEPRFSWTRWFEGQGVALGWRHIEQNLIDQGRLVTLARSNRPLTPNTVALRDWLKASAAQM